MKTTTKKFAKYLFFTFILTLTLSCSGTKKFMYSIPSDTDKLVGVNLNQLIDKAGVNKKKNKKVKDSFLQAIEKEITADELNQFKKIIDDPSQSGINTKGHLCFYSAPSLAYPVFTAEVKSQKQLKKLMETLENQGIADLVVYEKPYYHTVLAKKTFVIFDKKTILAINAPSSKIEAAKKQAISLLNLPKEESIVKNNAETFKKFKESKEDIVFYTDLEDLPSAYKREVEKALQKRLSDVNIRLVSTLNFEKGETHLTIKNIDQNALYANNKNMMKALSGNLLNLFPSNTLGLISFGINGKEIYKGLQQQENPDMDLEDKDLKNFIEGINGDCTIGAFTWGVDKGKPNFLMVIEANDKKIDLSAEIERSKVINKENIIELKENEYLYRKINTRSLPFSNYLPKDLFFGVKKNYIYITSDELIYKDLDNKIDKTMKDSPLTSNLKGNMFFATVNIEEVLDLPIIKIVAMFGGKQAQEMLDKAALFSHIEMKNKSNDLNITLYQKEKKETLLEILLEEIIKQSPLGL